MSASWRISQAQRTGIGWSMHSSPKASCYFCSKVSGSTRPIVRLGIDGDFARLANDPIDEAVPSLCVADGKTGRRHGANHEEEAPEISRMNAAAS